MKLIWIKNFKLLLLLYKIIFPNLESVPISVKKRKEEEKYGECCGRITV